MEGAIWGCPQEWEYLLPPGIRRISGEELSMRVWDLLAFMPKSLSTVEKWQVSCRILLVPGDCSVEELTRIRAERVVTCGLSPRDSLTLSSLAEPVLCIQRTLPRPDGTVVEPQEFLLPFLPFSAAEMLPLLGMWVLLADTGRSMLELVEKARNPL